MRKPIGPGTADSARPPSTRGWLSLSGGSYGSYRFRERLIRTATPIYALGWFHTVRSNPSDEFIDKQVDDLIRQWKLQPQRYLRDYDIDGNGKIQRQEWKLIRSAARREVLARINDEHREHHVMSRPQDSRQPFYRAGHDVFDSAAVTASLNTPVSQVALRVDLPLLSTWSHS